MLTLTNEKDKKFILEKDHQNASILYSSIVERYDLIEGNAKCRHKKIDL